MKKTTRSGSTRESFLRLRGGKLISIESYILGFLVFLVMSFVGNCSMAVSGIIALIVGFAFPILIGLFKSLAWIALVAFSLIWGILASAVFDFIWGILSHGNVALMAQGFPIVGLAAGIIAFGISFMIHKNYSGLMLQGVKSADRTDSDQQIHISTSEIMPESVAFCPKCGRRIHSIDGRCDVCDR